MSSRLLPILRDGAAAFSYECRACNRCCRGRGIMVNPYELIRLSVRLGISTTQCRRQWLDGNGIFLAQLDDGRCRFLGEQGCTIHSDRPLACRLYPLGRIVRASGEEQYVQLEAAEGSEGIYGEAGQVADYLRNQGVEAYIEAEAKYRELMARMAAAGGEGGAADSGDEETAAPEAESAVAWVLDPDPVISAWCQHNKVAEPVAAEARMECHLGALDAWIDGVWTPPAPSIRESA